MSEERELYKYKLEYYSGEAEIIEADQVVVKGDNLLGGGSPTITFYSNQNGNHTLLLHVLQDRVMKVINLSLVGENIEV